MRLVQRGGAHAGLRLDARWDGYVGIPDPRAAGMRVRFETDRHDSGWVDLPAVGWQRPLRFEDPGGAAVGVTSIVVRQRRGHGRFVLRARGSEAPVPLASATRIAVTIASGELRWCGAASELRTVGRRVVATSTTSLTRCPCPPLPPDTFAAIARRIFARHACAVAICHGNTPGQGGLTLAGDAAYGALIGVPSMIDPSMPRVVPGDPDRSMLWRKLAARTLRLGGVPGNSMPIGDPSLDVTELDAVRRWIAAGAPEHGTVPDAHALLDCGGPPVP
jgi:hypothetical protein